MSDRNLMDVTPTGLPPGTTAEDVAMASDSETPTPEEQAMYDKFVTRAVAFIHGEETEGAVIEMLNQKGTPVHENVGRTASKIVQLIEQSAATAGQPVPSDVVYAAGQEIVADLLETGVEAKIFPMQIDSAEYDQALELSFLEAVKNYGEELLAGPDGEQVSARAQDQYALQVAREADSGTLSPEMAEAAEREAANFGKMNPVTAAVQGAIGNG